MSRRIGFFVDVSNLYYCMGKKYPNRKISYSKLTEYVRGIGGITKSIAYGADKGKLTEGFIHFLKTLGFETKFKEPIGFAGNTRYKADWDVGITVDMLNMMDRFDTVILSTADGDLEPAVAHLVRQGVDVIILACGINKALKESATKFIEIPESMLEDETNKTNV